MHISLDEAISLLDEWKNWRTPLRVRISQAGDIREMEAVVVAVAGGLIGLSAGERETELVLIGAEFNGDRRSGPDERRGAYLVCEFPNGDRWSFQAPARPKSSSGTERRATE